MTLFTISPASPVVGRKLMAEFSPWYLHRRRPASIPKAAEPTLAASRWGAPDRQIPRSDGIVGKAARVGVALALQESLQAGNLVRSVSFFSCALSLKVSCAHNLLFFPDFSRSSVGSCATQSCFGRLAASPNPVRARAVLNPSHPSQTVRPHSPPPPFSLRPLHRCCLTLSQVSFILIKSNAFFLS